MINTKVYIETSKTIHCDNIVFHSFKRWLCEHALFFWLYNDAPSGGCEGYEDVASPWSYGWLHQTEILSWWLFLTSPWKYGWLAPPDWNPFVMTGFSFPWNYGWLHQTKIHLWWLFFSFRGLSGRFYCMCLTLLTLSFYYILLHQYNILYNIYTTPTPVASLTSCFH